MPEEAAHGEGQRDRRIEMGPGHVTEGVDHRHHEERGRDRPRGRPHVATTQRAGRVGARRDERQRERAE
jgi:hypothetical protein